MHEGARHKCPPGESALCKLAHDKDGIRAQLLKLDYGTRDRAQMMRGLRSRPASRRVVHKEWRGLFLNDKGERLESEGVSGIFYFAIARDRRVDVL